MAEVVAHYHPKLVELHNYRYAGLLVVCLKQVRLLSCTNSPGLLQCLTRYSAKVV